MRTLSQWQRIISAIPFLTKKDSELPAAKRIDEVKLEESPFFDSGKSFASLVDVDLNAFRTREKSRSVRRNITLPQWLDDMATVAKAAVFCGGITLQEKSPASGAGHPGASG